MAATTHAAARPAPGSAAGSVILWCLIGGCAAFGLAALPSVGLYVWGMGLVLAIVAALVPGVDRRLWPAALLGAAIAPAYIAWLNREGPGTICHPIEDGVTCGEQSSPWPCVVVALALVMVGALLLYRASRRPAR